MNAPSPLSGSSSAYQDAVVAIPALDSFTSTNFPQHRIVVQANSSRWMQDLENRFEKATKLPVGWDGYDGVPVSFTTAQFATQMIERLYVPNVPTPNIVPGSDGSLQIEWHVAGFDIELDVVGPNEVEAYRLNQNTGDEDEIEVDIDFTEIASWISDIANARADEDAAQAAG